MSRASTRLSVRISGGPSDSHAKTTDGAGNIRVAGFPVTDTACPVHAAQLQSPRRPPSQSPAAEDFLMAFPERLGPDYSNIHSSVSGVTGGGGGIRGDRPSPASAVGIRLRCSASVPGICPRPIGPRRGSSLPLRRSVHGQTVAAKAGQGGGGRRCRGRDPSCSMSRGVSTRGFCAGSCAAVRAVRRTRK